MYLLSLSLSLIERDLQIARKDLEHYKILLKRFDKVWYFQSESQQFLKLIRIGKQLHSQVSNNTHKNWCFPSSSVSPAEATTTNTNTNTGTINTMITPSWYVKCKYYITYYIPYSCYYSMCCYKHRRLQDIYTYTTLYMKKIQRLREAALLVSFEKLLEEEFIRQVPIISKVSKRFYTASNDMIGMELLHFTIQDLLGSTSLESKIFRNKINRDYPYRRHISRLLQYVLLYVIVIINIIAIGVIVWLVIAVSSPLTLSTSSSTLSATSQSLSSPSLDDEDELDELHTKLAYVPIILWIVAIGIESIILETLSVTYFDYLLPYSVLHEVRSCFLLATSLMNQHFYSQFPSVCSEIEKVLLNEKMIKEREKELKELQEKELRGSVSEKKVEKKVVREVEKEVVQPQVETVSNSIAVTDETVPSGLSTFRGEHSGNSAGMSRGSHVSGKEGGGGSESGGIVEEREVEKEAVVQGDKVVEEDRDGEDSGKSEERDKVDITLNPGVIGVVGKESDVVVDKVKEGDKDKHDKDKDRDKKDERVMIINGWEYNTIANALAMAYPTTLEALQILSIRSYAPPPSLEATMRRKRLIPHYATSTSVNGSTSGMLSNSPSASSLSIVIPNMSLTERIVDYWQIYLVDRCSFFVHEIVVKLSMLLSIFALLFTIASPISYTIYTLPEIDRLERYNDDMNGGNGMQLDDVLDDERENMIISTTITGSIFVIMLISFILWLYSLIVVVQEQQQRYQHNQVHRQGSNNSGGSSSGLSSSNNIPMTAGNGGISGDGSVRRMSFTSMLER